MTASARLPVRRLQCRCGSGWRGATPRLRCRAGLGGGIVTASRHPAERLSTSISHRSNRRPSCRAGSRHRAAGVGARAHGPRFHVCVPVETGRRGPRLRSTHTLAGTPGVQGDLKGNPLRTPPSASSSCRLVRGRPADRVPSSAPRKFLHSLGIVSCSTTLARFAPGVAVASAAPAP
jgi:hypothetical protein